MQTAVFKLKYLQESAASVQLAILTQ